MGFGFGIVGDGGTEGNLGKLGAGSEIPTLVSQSLEGTVSRGHLGSGLLSGNFKAVTPH